MTALDPRTLQVRYVGKSDSPELRLAVHQTRSKTGDTPAEQWLHELAEMGKEPILVIVEECLKADWPARERFWITLLRRNGADLTNTNDGGLGAMNPCAATRMKTIASHKGKQHSVAARVKMSKAKFGRPWSKARRLAQEKRE